MGLIGDIMDYEEVKQQNRLDDASKRLNNCILCAMEWIGDYPNLQVVFDYLEHFLCPVRTGEDGYITVRDSDVKNRLRRAKKQGLAMFEPECISDFENLAYAFKKYQMEYNYSIEYKSDKGEISFEGLKRGEGSE